MKIQRLLLLISFLSLSGFGACEKAKTWRDAAFTKHLIRADSGPVELPSSLWTKIEGLYRRTPYKEGEVRPEGVSGPALGEGVALPTDFAPLTVFLVEKNKGILHHEDHQLVFGPGGGDIDLNDYVQPLNGSFYFVADFLPDAEDIQRHVYFLSNSIIRHNPGENQLGSGCDTYFDVSSAFSKAMMGEGFLLNTRDQRHVSALAGTYFFAAVQGGKLAVASLRIHDSAHSALQCKK